MGAWGGIVTNLYEEGASTRSLSYLGCILITRTHARTCVLCDIKRIDIHFNIFASSLFAQHST